MRILLNGSETDVQNDCTLATLISILELTGKRTAIEVNEEVVPRADYSEHGLKEGDRVEVVHAVGGG